MDSEAEDLDALFGEESSENHPVEEKSGEGASSPPAIEQKDSPRPSKRINSASVVRQKEMTLGQINRFVDHKRAAFLLKLPGFLGIDREPYTSGRVLQEELSSYDSSSGREVLLRAATAIRWRRDVKQHHALQTNARLVKWSDGSFSLLVGRELFEITHHNMAGENNFIYARHSAQNVMECVTKLRSRLTVRPYILPDQSHRKYLAAAASASAKASADVRVKMAVTMADPEQEKQRMVKLEQEKIKARRKLEARRRNLQQRSYDRVTKTGLTARFLEDEDDLDDDEAHEGGIGKQVAADEDEYEQDFIDDEEIVTDDDSEDGSKEAAEDEFSSLSETEASNEEVASEPISKRTKSRTITNNSKGPLSPRKRQSAIIDDEEQ